ncbi:MAG TPA: hypothetical protein VMI10_10435 [Terriglobales bacterium]|nr:hypothetical protein [Terriglobales bacterium]HTT21696.1 hypothetical protein [Candidatus Sulfotelmatobacter sp.]
MATRRPPPETVVRVNFQVALSVNPLLASDLQRFTLGRSRHARLLTLAMLGLLSETRTLNGGSLLPNLNEAGRDTAGARTGGQKTRLSDHDFADIGE